MCLLMSIELTSWQLGTCGSGKNDRSWAREPGGQRGSAGAWGICKYVCVYLRTWTVSCVSACSSDLSLPAKQKEDMVVHACVLCESCM